MASELENLTLQLDNPPQGVYFPGMTVSGVVIVENNKEPKTFRTIDVKLTGEATVHWSVERTSRTDDNRTVVTYIDYSGYETYIECRSVLWDRDKDAPDGVYPLGTYRYQFSFPLVAPKLPPTHLGSGNASGRIKYDIVAAVNADGYSGFNSAYTSITVANEVPISHPSLQQPHSKEVRKTLCCLCCASGPIVITATVPRTGYCVGHDSIPLEVTVENGSSRTVRQLVASIVKNVAYFGSHLGPRKKGPGSGSTTITSTASESIAPHITLVWKPETFDVPDVETTLDNCDVITVDYSLKVHGAIDYAFDPTIEIPLVLGNIPLTA